MKYWIIKSEPSCYSIYDLQKQKIGHWDGVRNYQARNFLRDDMKKDDLCIFYHSNATPSGAAGVCRIVKEGYPDHTAFQPMEKHFDPDSDPKNPRWFMVDVAFEKVFPKFIPLSEIKENTLLSHIALVQKGSRLSVMPIDKNAFEEICKMGENIFM